MISCKHQIVLFDVDTQKDFMRSDGGLYVPGSEEIIPNIEKLVRTVIAVGGRILSTVDWHAYDDQEFKSFPPHCVEETVGAEKIPETYGYGESYIDFVKKGIPKDGIQQALLAKATYDIWDTSLGNPVAVESFVKDASAVLLMGVATDICVLAAAKGLSERYNGKKKLFLITDCIKGLSHEVEAVNHMAEIGFQLVDSSIL